MVRPISPHVLARTTGDYLAIADASQPAPQFREFLKILSRPVRGLDPSFLSVRRLRCVLCGEVGEVQPRGYCSNPKCKIYSPDLKAATK